MVILPYKATLGYPQYSFLPFCIRGWDPVPQVILASDSEEAKTMASHPKKKLAAPLKNQKPTQMEDAQSTWRVGDLQRFDMI